MSAPLRTWLIGLMLLSFGVVLIAAGVYPVAEMQTLARRVRPVLVFVGAVTVMPELAAESGLFDVIADGAAGVGMDPLPFAFTTVWMANTASMLLPVSTLTNVLAQQRLGDISPGHFATLTVGAEIAGVLVPLAVLLVVFRRRIVCRYQRVAPRVDGTRDEPLLVIVAVIVVAFIIGISSGPPAWQPACVAATLMVLAFAWRRREALGFGLFPSPMLVLFCGMFVAVGALGAWGLTTFLEDLVPGGSGPGAMLATAGLGTTSANLVNNLPAYLALEPAAHGSNGIIALLMGVNIGPPDPVGLSGHAAVKRPASTTRRHDLLASLCGARTARRTADRDLRSSDSSGDQRGAMRWCDEVV